jgi:hypothetical protein
MLSPLLISILCAVVLCDKIGTTPAARPQVSIGATTILGTRGPSHIEFFGGAISVLFQLLDTLLNLLEQESHSRSLLSVI